MTKKQLEEKVLELTSALSNLIDDMEDVVPATSDVVRVKLESAIARASRKMCNLQFTYDVASRHLLYVDDEERFQESMNRLGTGWKSIDDVPLIQQRLWRQDPMIMNIIGVAPTKRGE